MSTSVTPISVDRNLLEIDLKGSTRLRSGPEDGGSVDGSFPRNVYKVAPKLIVEVVKVVTWWHSYNGSEDGGPESSVREI